MAPERRTAQVAWRIWERRFETLIDVAVVITDADKDRHPYYDWQSQHSDMRFRLVGQVHVAPGVQAGVALHRSRRKCGFAPADHDQARAN